MKSLPKQSNAPVWRQKLNESYSKFVAINPERAKTELGVALQIFQSNTTLQKCNPQSIFDAVVNVARTSVSLNPVLRLAYLIPRKNQCILEITFLLYLINPIIQFKTVINFLKY